MSNTGNDPLRGKFTRFLMYTVDNTVSNYLRKNRVREYPVGILKSQRVDFSSEGSHLRGFDFNWDELAQAYCNLPRSYQEVLFLLLHLYLAGCPGSDRGGSKLEGGAKYHPVWLAGLCIGSGRYRAVFHWADVYSPGGLPHSGQYPKKGRSPCDGGPAGLFRCQCFRPDPRAAGCGRR